MCCAACAGVYTSTEEDDIRVRLDDLRDDGLGVALRSKRNGCLTGHCTLHGCELTLECGDLRLAGSGAVVYQEDRVRGQTRLSGG